MDDFLMTMVATLLERPVVIGASGLVGGALLDALRIKGYRPVGTFLGEGREGMVELDISNPVPALDALAPSIVFLAAAVTNVDWSESHRDEALRVNVEGLRVVASYCDRKSVPLVFFSSDYVFDGKDGPYAEGDRRAPLNVYGESKVLGEDIVLATPRSVVLRITNVFDIGYDERNFLYRVIASLRDGRRLRLPADQLSTPTYATWLGGQIVALVERGAICAPDRPPQTLHLACDDMISRLEFANRIAVALGADAKLITSVDTSSLAQPAKRPLRGGLRNDRLKALLHVEHISLDDALRELSPRMHALYHGKPVVMAHGAARQW